MHCKNCNLLLKPAATRKSVGSKVFCNITCQHEFQAKKRIQDFLDGKYVGEFLQYRTGEWTRRFLIESFGYKCSCCGIDSWQGKEVVLEVNHKDGDAKNNVLDNVEFLCPNCHSQTDTFRAKNKNGTRSFRKSGRVALYKVSA
jgi:5-methylcytosine-specific restriction endonuclease McrA